ncbi:MAG TPA: FAD-binding oxidoreductase [Longimicrobiales bacterium]|nr:FAD-binding oxidoreductase [Longimicrobiales bacterium]
MSTPAGTVLAGLLPAEALRAPGDVEEWTVGGAPPEAVAEPSSVEEIKVVLAAAAASGFSVVPLGARTDPGPEPPRGRFVVLSTRRLAGVEDYQPADLTVTARAGTMLATLGGALAERGQWLPVDPPFTPGKTLGGLVATGAAGSLGMAFGTPRDHVLGLSVVTGDGRVLHLGGRVMKNVAGFDLVKLMVGSRGTLGVVVSASLRLFPRPMEERAVVLEGEGPGALLDAARRVATAGVVPASAVLMSPGPGGGGSALVVRVQGAGAAVEADVGKLLGPSLGLAASLRGTEAQRTFEAVRDHAARHTLVLRGFALPGLLAEVLSAVQDAVPVAALAADVMSGRVRVGVESGVEAASLTRLRARLEALGGSLVVERGAPELLAGFPAYGSAGKAAELGRALRVRFDPLGVLSPGRFET